MPRANLCIHASSEALTRAHSTCDMRPHGHQASLSPGLYTEQDFPRSRRTASNSPGHALLFCAPLLLLSTTLIEHVVHAMNRKGDRHRLSRDWESTPRETEDPVRRWLRMACAISVEGRATSNCCPISPYFITCSPRAHRQCRVETRTSCRAKKTLLRMQERVYPHLPQRTRFAP